MKNKLYITVALIAYCQMALSQPIYVSKDEHGNFVYSDARPLEGQYESSPLSNVQTTQWVKTPKIKSKHKIQQNRKSSGQKSRFEERRKTCKQLKKQLDKIEFRLSKRNKAAAFNNLKEKLGTKRKTYRKSCT
ncbi:MAG: hypothetical protein OQK51_13520 [Kangiellaceae bacterium]|nr:hypothetical protein [Kangiellaceae bacterium]